MKKGYAQAIVDEYKKHARANEQAIEDNDVIAESFHAFMCNAISSAVRAGRQDVKELFWQEIDRKSK